MGLLNGLRYGSWFEKGSTGYCGGSGFGASLRGFEIDGHRVDGPISRVVNRK